MRRNLKPVRRVTRADTRAVPRAPRTPATDILEPIGGSEETQSLDGEPPHAAEEKDSDEPTGPDDALGLYLRQMGAIPLLTRQQELDLARRLERARTRYRRAALANWRTVAMTVAT